MLLVVVVVASGGSEVVGKKAVVGVGFDVRSRLSSGVLPSLPNSRPQMWTTGGGGKTGGRD